MALRRVRAGEAITDTLFNGLVDEVKRLQNLTVAAPLSLIKGQTGYHILTKAAFKLIYAATTGAPQTLPGNGAATIVNVQGTGFFNGITIDATGNVFVIQSAGTYLLSFFASLGGAAGMSPTQDVNVWTFDFQKNGSAVSPHGTSRQGVDYRLVVNDGAGSQCICIVYPAPNLAESDEISLEFTAPAVADTDATLWDSCFFLLKLE